MILDLTPEQNADRERLGACVVLGEVIPGECPFHTYKRPGCRTCIDFRPPQQWRHADGPCPCWGEGGWMFVDCRDGKPIIEIRVPCPTCGGSGGVVVSRATVTLLPVVDVVDTTFGDTGMKAAVFGTGRVGILNWGVPGRLMPEALTGPMTFDPLPVAGRDWVAVFEEAV